MVTRDDILAEGLPLTDAEIAGFMNWRGPGAYTAHAMRRVKQSIAEAVAREREACAEEANKLEHLDWCADNTQDNIAAAIRARKGGAA